MVTLAAQFQELVDLGLIRPTLVAPHIENLFGREQIRMRTAYNIGEAMIRDEETQNAKLDSGLRGNSNKKRDAS